MIHLQKNDEMNIAKNLQQSMYTYLLRKSDKYSVSFQDVERTNALLKSKGVYSKLDELNAGLRFAKFECRCSD